MQAASRQSLVFGRESLDGIVGRTGSDGARVLGDELFAVLDVLGRERVLLRHLTDPSAEPEARRQLVDTLFGGKVADSTLELLTQLAGSRWSRTTDLLDTVELLAREAFLAVAEHDGGLEDVEDELFRFARILESQPRLLEHLSNPLAPVRRRVDLLDQLIADKVRPVTKRLLDAAVRLPRTRDLVAVVDKLAELAAARRDRSVAHVTAAAPLSQEQERRLVDALSRIFARQISIRVVLVPEVLGGLVIRVGDEVIDGSVAARLARARQELPG